MPAAATPRPRGEPGFRAELATRPPPPRRPGPNACETRQVCRAGDSCVRRNSRVNPATGWLGRGLAANHRNRRASTKTPGWRRLFRPRAQRRAANRPQRRRPRRGRCPRAAGWRAAGDRVGLHDAVEHAGADDAAAAPDRRDLAEVQVPPIQFARRAHHARNLGRRRRSWPRRARADRLQVGSADRERRLPRMRKRFCDGETQIAPRRKRARIDRLGDRGDRNAKVKRRLRGPAPRSLLLGFVENRVDQRAARRLALAQHDRRDLDQVGIEFARVPSREYVADRRRRQAVGGVQNVIDLGDELHVGVFDAVMHHLDVVARAARADAARSRPCPSPARPSSVMNGAMRS